MQKPSPVENRLILQRHLVANGYKKVTEKEKNDFVKFIDTKLVSLREGKTNAL